MLTLRGSDLLGRLAGKVVAGTPSSYLFRHSDDVDVDKHGS